MPVLEPHDLAAILDGVSDGVLAFDRDWRFTFLNSAGARMLGKGRESLLGTELWEQFPGLVETRFGQSYLRSMETQRSEILEDFYAPFGAWFEVRTFPSKTALILFFRDITERQQAQQSLIESERRFRLMAEAVPQLLWIARTDASIDYMNSQWYRFTQSSAEESAGTAWLNYVHPDDLPAIHAVWQRANASARPFEFETRVRRSDGQFRWLLARAYPELDARGNVLRWYGASTDITEHKRASEQLQLSEQRYRTFVAQSTEGIWRMETDHPVDTSLPAEAQVDAIFRESVLAECNDAMARMYGVNSAAELTGARLTELMPPDDEKNRGYLRAFVESGYRLEGGESRERGRDRRLRIFQNSLVGFVERGQLLRAWGTQRDITAEVESREQTERLTGALEEAIRTRDDFLSVASHELKTPLTPLSLRLESLAREAGRQSPGPFVDSVLRYVDTGRRQVRRLNELVGDLLDVSRIASGRFSFHFETVDLSQLVRDVSTRFEPEAARLGSPLTLAIDGAVEGEWDRLRLEQVADNLISNALKYGDGKPIRVSVLAAGGAAVLRVEDQGIGIDPEARTRIFERFERAVSHRHYGGLGLGLYITRTIVDALGGEIHLESEPGRGTLFEIRLPRERAAALSDPPAPA